MKNLIKTTIAAVLASSLFAATSVTLNNTATDIIVELNSDKVYLSLHKHSICIYHIDTNP